MKTRKNTPAATEPRPGDFFHLKVPSNRHLQPGTYIARIERAVPLKRSTRKHPAVAYHCVIVLTSWLEEMAGQSTDFDNPDAFLIHFRLTTYGHEALQGQCFLGPDQFPVEVRHEPCIERRLRDSLPVERLPYADD